MSKTVDFYLTLLCTFLMCGACSWVDDDYSDCPSGCWLKLSYTYNMLNVDAASTQVTDATVFVFNNEGNCIARQEVDSLSFHLNKGLIKMPILPAGEYSFLVWAGLADTHYRYTPDALTLLRNEAGEQTERLKALFHGRLDNVQVNDEYTVMEVSLTKNTKTLSCILQSQSDTPLNKDEFSLELTARNGLMDHRNQPVDSVVTCYRPFYQDNIEMEGLQIVHAGIHTLRLMEDDDTRLTLIHQPQGERIFCIPLSRYLLLSRQVHVPVMEAQEYLDRQDQYNLIFFLTATGDSLKPYICTKMQVNSWIIRLNDVELHD